MKIKVLAFTITALIVTTGLTAFAQENEKAAQARKDIANAQQDLKEAKIDSAADYQKFKKDAEMNISENKESIEKLKAKKTSENKEVNEKYAEKVSELEKKNDELNKRIEGSEKTKTSKWTSFKNEFSHDMSELGKAIKDIGVNNEK